MIKGKFADFSISLFNACIRKFGYHIDVKKIPESICQDCRSDLLCINVGSGDWEAEGWINLDYPTIWYSNVQSKHKITPYDIRKDKLPFEDNSVDRIYCSHVIEHIEELLLNNI